MNEAQTHAAPTDNDISLLGGDPLPSSISVSFLSFGPLCFCQKVCIKLLLGFKQSKRIMSQVNLHIHSKYFLTVNYVALI